jgi:hypothetical protein
MPGEFVEKKLRVFWGLSWPLAAQVTLLYLKD